jgi:hypothetical protein
MITVSDSRRNLFLGALMALILLVALGGITSEASAVTTKKSNPLVFEPQVQSECPGGYVCFWSGKTFGRGECESGQNCYSQFHGYEVGWHNLENINPQSMWNHTGEHLAVFYVGLFGEVEHGIYPGETTQWNSPYKGGFEMR